MKQMRFPIRLKIMIALLFSITAVVSVITFTMANFFHDDKQSYVTDWVSIAAQTTAEECNSVIVGYTQRLQLASLSMLNEEADGATRERVLQEIFDNFPQLVEITLHGEDGELGRATDMQTLERLGMTVADLEGNDRESLPIERILDGEIYVRNSTVSPELPSLTLAVSLDAGGDRPPVVITSVLRLEELQKIGAKFKVLEVVLADSEGILLAHPDPREVARRRPARLHAEAARVHEEFSAGMTREFTRDGVEVIGGFARVDSAGITAAAHMPKSAAYLASRELLGRMVMAGVVLLVIVAIAGRVWSSRITRPVERLSKATRKIAKGEFEIHVDVETHDEIGELAGSFNQMASELKTRDEELDEAQSALVQSEKLAAFGQLGAGIAHEVKNPLAGILGCAQLSLMEIQPGSHLHENLQIIEKETTRCKTIIDSLLKFARQEKTLFDPIDVNTVAVDAVAIVNHQLELNNVKIVKELGEDLPQISGNGNQLQQVLMNLMMNAQQAMEGEQGTVTVSTRHTKPDRLQISVRDTGPGMTPEVKTKLFEPFFTTKPTGKGTGLGLSVSFGIVKDHHGEIVVNSKPGEGAEFVITLPTISAADAPQVGGEAKSA